MKRRRGFWLAQLSILALVVSVLSVGCQQESSPPSPDADPNVELNIEVPVELDA